MSSGCPLFTVHGKSGEGKGGGEEESCADCFVVNVLVTKQHISKAICPLLPPAGGAGGELEHSVQCTVASLLLYIFISEVCFKRLYQLICVFVPTYETSCLG